MYCNKCGNELEENSVFCSECGNKVLEDINENQDVKENIEKVYSKEQEVNETSKEIEIDGEKKEKTSELKKKKNRKIMMILLWVLFWPIMLIYKCCELIMKKLNKPFDTKKGVIATIIVLLIIGLPMELLKRNSIEYQMYTFWSEYSKSEWVILEVEDYDDVEIIKEDENHYYAEMNVVGRNVVEEKKNYELYCYAFVNDEGKLVEKLSACMLR